MLSFLIYATTHASFARQFAFWIIAECYISKDDDTNNPYSVKVLLGCTITGPPNQKCNVT